MKKHLIILFALVFQMSINAQDNKSYERLMKLPVKKVASKNGDIYLKADFTEVLTGQTNKKTLQEETIEMLDFLNAPHPSVGTIKNQLKEAANEFNVPLPILEAIAKTYNNYCMYGPSEYGAYGVMGLVENESNQLLSKAASLIKIDIEDVKTNSRQNIRATAAILAEYGKDIKDPKNLISWFEAVKEVTGLSDEFTKEMQAIDYYKVMNNGRNTITLWKETAEISPLNDNNINRLIKNYNSRLKQTTNKGATTGTVDYPSAVGAFTNCNFSSRGGRDIDTWVNHYIAVGTVAGAISHFRNCNAEASAHFIIAVDGTVYQSVKVASKAWHSGVKGKPNNERSIGTEHDVTVSTPSNWNNTTMLEASTDLARYYCNKYAIPKTRSLPGIRGHKEMPGASTDCPFTLPWTTWMNMLNNNTPPPPTSNTPVPVSPANGATNLSLPINFTYTSPVNAGAFRIQVSTSNSGWNETDGFTTNSSPNTTVIVNASITTNNYYWNETALGSYEGPKAGKTYYYTIRSWDAATGTSKYSAVRTVSTEFGVQPIAPTNAANVNSPANISWASSVSGASCRLQISRVNSGWTADNGFTTDSSPTTSVPVNYSTANLLNYTWPNQYTESQDLPTSGNTYYWTVRLWSPSTGSSKYTPVRSFTINGTTSKMTFNTSDILLYPNPSTGTLNISFESNTEEAEVNIYDISGNTVFTKKYKTEKGTVTINEDISKLKNGNYFLLLNDGEKIMNQNLSINNK
jgi:N-acetyl-anhydromuramyl-L-alanine amidase AmpD